MSLTKQDLADIRLVVVAAINDSFELLSAPRFDALEGRIENLDGRMGNLEGRVGNLETGQSATNRHLEAIDRRLDSIDSSIETLKNDVMALYDLLGESIYPVPDKDFEHLGNEDKVRALYAHTLKLAKKLNIELS